MKEEKGMNYYELLDPYYALVKAKNKEEAVGKYIEVVAGEESDIGALLEECKLVPEYYASARLAQSKSENGKLIDLEEVVEAFKRYKTEIMLVDSSVL